MPLSSLKKYKRAIRNTAPLLLAGWLVTGCTDDSATDTPVSDTVRIELTASTTSNLSQPHETKAEQTSIPFPIGTHLIGLWVCKHQEENFGGEHEPAMEHYENIRAELRVAGTAGKPETYQQTWQYTYNNNLHDYLNVERGKPIDLFAYTPRSDSQTGKDLTAVPFASGKTDWMWSAPLHCDDDDPNSNIIQAPLVFYHAMTCLDVMVKCTHGNIRLTSITLQDEHEPGRIYTKGTMNLVTRKLNLSDTDKSDELKLTYNNSLSSSVYTSFRIIIPPVANYNGGFKLQFTFSGSEAEHTFSIPTEMNNDVKVTAFETGKRYVYKLTMDNTLHFEAVGIDDKWNDEEFELIL